MVGMKCHAVSSLQAPPLSGAGHPLPARPPVSLVASFQERQSVDASIHAAQLEVKAFAIASELATRFLTSQVPGGEFWNECKKSLDAHLIFDHQGSALVARKFFALVIPEMARSSFEGETAAAANLFKEIGALLRANCYDKAFNDTYGYGSDKGSWHKAFYSGIAAFAENRPLASIPLEGIWLTLVVTTAHYAAVEIRTRGRFETSYAATDAYHHIVDKLATPIPPSLAKLIAKKRENVPVSGYGSLRGYDSEKSASS